MKLFKKLKDGGPESSVTGYFLVEIKSLFSIVLLRFEGESREAYHTHAFDAVSWLLSGSLWEQFKDKNSVDNFYWPSLIPIVTRRSAFHKVSAGNVSWVLSFRGPWGKTWLDHDEKTNKTNVLGHGRKVLGVN